MPSLTTVRKVLSIIGITLEEAFSYRLNFVMWRVRQVFVFLIPYFIWRGVLGQGGELYGYSFGSLMTYLFGTTLLRSLVMGSRTVDLGWMINSGYLTLVLLKPINNFTFMLARDLGDKLYNLSFIVLEVPLLLLLFRPPVFLQSDPLTLLITIVSIILALYIYFYINILFGSIGFWSRDVWAPRFLLMVILEFATGAMLPLDMLPTWLQQILAATPFPSLLYVPLELYLGKSPSPFSSLALQLFWVVVLGVLARYVWGRGLRRYEAEGR